MTIVLTTHLLEEADGADRIAILNEGQLVALGTPDALRATVGGDSITIDTADPAALAAGDRRAVLALLHGLSTARCGWSCRTATTGSPGWWRRSPARSRPFARQADARRRVHRPHGPSLLARGVRAVRDGRGMSSVQASNSASRPAAPDSRRRQRPASPPLSPRARSAGEIVPLLSPAQPDRRLDRHAAGLLAAVRRGPAQSFRVGQGPDGQSFLQYFFPGSLLLILLFTAIFASISIIEDRREGFLQAVLVAPIPRWAMVLGKVLGGHADRPVSRVDLFAARPNLAYRACSRCGGGAVGCRCCWSRRWRSPASASCSPGRPTARKGFTPS